jgi:DNA-binding response OmpR family regulator
MADLLLVDDDRRIVELVAFFLTRRGHSVRIAQTFGEARAAIVERAPELMLSDVDLGHERSDEELPKLAADALLPPTLIVSGYLDADLEARLQSIPGVLGTVRKPFDLAALEARIESLIARSSSAHAVAAPKDDDEGWTEIRAAEAGS